MAKDSETLKLIIKAKEEASKKVKKLDAAFTGLRKNVNKLPGLFLNLKTAIAGAATVLIARDLMKASDEQAKAVMGLETALRSMGRYTPQLFRSLQDVASGLQDITNYGDEATLRGIKFLVTYRDITDDLLPQTTSVMLDLATMMGGDVRSAANMLGKASMGMTAELRRAGITVDAETYRLKGFAGVLEEIAKQVRGQAEAERKATGAYKAVSNQVGDIKEKLGDMIKMTIGAGGEYVLLFFKKIDERLKEIRDSAEFKGWADRTAPKLVNGLKTIALITARVGDAFHGWHMILEGLRGATSAYFLILTAGLKKYLEMQKTMMAFSPLRFTSMPEKLEAGIRELNIAKGFFNEQLDKSVINLEKLSSQESNYEKLKRFLEEAAKKANELATGAVKSSKALDGMADSGDKVAKAIKAAKPALEDFEKAAKKAYDEARKKAEEYAKKAIEWNEKIKQSRLTAEDKIRELIRMGMSELETWDDKRLQAQEKLSAAKAAAAKKDMALAEQLTKQAMDLYAGLAGEVTRTDKEGKSIVVKSIDETKQIAIAGVKETQNFLESLYSMQKKAAEETTKQYYQAAEDIKKSLDEIAKTREAKVFVELENLEAAKASLDAWLQSPATKIVRIKTIEEKAVGGIAGMARGGRLPGWGGGDRISALLEAGEFIIRKEAVRRYGAGLFAALNNMRLPIPDIRIPKIAYATGGQVMGGIKDLGRVEIAVGGKAYPVMGQVDVINELKSAIKKEKLLRSN